MTVPMNPTQEQLKRIMATPLGAPIALTNILALNPSESSQVNGDAIMNPTVFVMEVTELRWSFLVSIPLAGTTGT